MREVGSLWKLRVHAVEQARRSLGRGDPDAVHDLRVALRRVSAAADAIGRGKVSRAAQSVTRSLSGQRQLEVDRRLLARLGALGFLSSDAVAALGARWDRLATRGQRRTARAAEGRKIRFVLERLERLSRRRGRKTVARLERARRGAEKALARGLEGEDDRALHRRRLAVKRARYLAEDLAGLGRTEWAAHAEKEKSLQEALGRWNDLRMFCRRLEASRQEAEVRGAMVLAAELSRLLAALEPVLTSVRRRAVDACRRAARVVPIRRCAAALG